jgi:hypothetical protein
MNRLPAAIGIALGILSPFAAPTFSQTTGANEAMSILNRLPPDVYAKIQALAQMLDQSIKEGKLSEADVQRDLLSGHLGDRLRSVNPEAGRMLDELNEALQNGRGPGPESLMPLLGGLR